MKMSWKMMLAAAVSLLTSSEVSANDDFHCRFALQLRLKQERLYSAGLDGRFGAGTQKAIEAYAGKAGIATNHDAVRDHMIRSAVEARVNLSAGLVEAATTALKNSLKDPYSAVIDVEYAYMQPGGAAVCGTVNAKNEYGAFVGKQQFQVSVLPAFGADPPFTGIVVLFDDDGASWKCLLGTSPLAG